MELRTSRLVIRDLEESDRLSVVAWRGDPEVMRHLDNPEDATPDAWFDRRVASNARRPRQAYDLSIRLRRTGEPIGWIGLAWAYDGSIGDLVMGYALRQESWGQGYAAEAAGAVLGFAFGELNAGSVFAECYEDNHRSARVLEKAGLEFDGPAPSFDPGLGASVRYIARKATWKPRRRRRLGLFVTLALVALLLVPLGVSAAVDRLGGPHAATDPRLLRWTPRGELVGDRDFIDLATKVWRTFADGGSTMPPPGDEIDLVFAGRVGSRRIAILQSVGPSGHAVIAQVAEHGDPPELVVDRVQRLDPSARGVVVTAATNDEDLSGGSASGDKEIHYATVRLVLAPDPTPRGADSPDSSGTGSGPGPTASGPAGSRATVSGARRVPSGRRVAGEVGVGRGVWRDLTFDASGVSSPWDEDSGLATTVIVRRSGPAGTSRTSTMSVQEGSVLAERPLVDLVAPSWGAAGQGTVSGQAYDDMQQVRLWTGTQDSTIDVAVLEDKELPGGPRVGLFEVVADQQRSVVLLVLAGRETVCADVRPIDRLRGRSVVAASCSGSRGTFGAVAARPGVAGLTVQVEGRTTRVPARGWAAALPVTPTASEAGGDGDGVGGVARAYDRAGKALGSADF